MKKWLAIVVVLVCWSNAEAQSSDVNFIEQFYADLNTGDSAKIRSYFFDDAVIRHIDKDTSYSFDLDGFMGVAPKFESKKFQEEIIHIEFYKHGGLANMVEVYFKFFLDGEYHHCGSDIFYITVDDSVYYSKIKEVTSIEKGCWEPSDQEKESVEKLEKDKSWSLREVEKIMNDWHVNAADANMEPYFAVMADDFFFLGTDPTERWSKKEFYDFSKPYFDRGDAWEFEAEERNWDISEDGNTAWFDEYLFTTNMNYCRGSGVLQRIDGEWKIYHYNLTVLIENEKMKKFLKLRKK